MKKIKKLELISVPVLNILPLISPSEIKATCIEEVKFMAEDGSIMYSYEFMTILNEEDDPNITPIVTLKIDNLTSQKYEITKIYYFTPQTKLRD